MSLSVFLLFLFSTVLVSATPGPNMLLAFQYGLNHGVRQTLWVLAGLSFGLFMLLVSALLGIDIISRKLPWLLTVMKVAGALYLIYLGVQMILFNLTKTLSLKFLKVWLKLKLKVI